MSVQSIATRNPRKIGNTVLGLLLTLTLTGCFDGDKRSATSPSAGSTNGTTTGTTVGTTPTNGAPKISGTPPTSAKVNEPYAFQPTASDPDGDKLTFQIANKPAWATFDSSTGRLSGTPSTSYTGTFADIRISVTDGKATSSLSTFAVSVASLQLGSATLSWQPPSSNTDGSPLTNLAGYVVRYGTSLSTLSTEVRVSNPGLTTYVVSELVPATWYFQVSAYNTSGVESAPSATASKTIS